MNTMDIRRYEMLVRVRQFGTDHRELFPASSLAGKMFATVANSVGELSKQAASQVSGKSAAREGTSTKAVARSALRFAPAGHVFAGAGLASVRARDGCARCIDAFHGARAVYSHDGSVCRSI